MVLWFRLQPRPSSPDTYYLAELAQEIQSEKGVWKQKA